MNGAGKGYNTSYKKKGDIGRDTYLPKKSPRGLIQCDNCGAVYFRQRWTAAAADVPNWRQMQKRAIAGVCPACRKIRDDYPSGEVSVVGLGPEETREIVRLLRNEEARAVEKNPLGRIMRIERTGRGLRVETTTEKLAQRLGRALEKARKGKAEYRWSHKNKFVRVTWRKNEPASP
jgi:NMD protein affecting ribosome stability and mRNA decay